MDCIELMFSLVKLHSIIAEEKSTFLQIIPRSHEVMTQACVQWRTKTPCAKIHVMNIFCHLLCRTHHVCDVTLTRYK